MTCRAFESPACFFVVAFAVIPRAAGNDEEILKLMTLPFRV
jgi:hypothetical protein